MKFSISALLAAILLVGCQTPSPSTQSTEVSSPFKAYPAGLMPDGIAVDATGDVWATNDVASGTVTELSPAGATLRTIQGVGDYPRDIAVDMSGNLWVVADILWGGSTYVPKAGVVTELAPDGSMLRKISIGPQPLGIVCDRQNGHIWILDGQDSRVIEFSASGVNLGSFAITDTPSQIGIDASGEVWLQESGRTEELSPDGASLGKFADGSIPTDVALIGKAIDRHGNVWLVGRDRAVTEQAPTGNVIAHFVVGRGPTDIAADASGHLWVTNLYDDTVSEIPDDATGTP